MTVATRLFLLRATHAVRRAERVRRRTLVRELAAYSSDADRCELEAILDRYPDGLTHELREILARQALRRAARDAGPGARAA